MANQTATLKQELQPKNGKRRPPYRERGKAEQTPRFEREVSLPSLNAGRPTSKGRPTDMVIAGKAL